MVTDSERFYSSILDLLEDVDEQEDVNALLVWWNRFVLSPQPIGDSLTMTQADISDLFFGKANCSREQRIRQDQGKARRAALKNAARMPG